MTTSTPLPPSSKFSFWHNGPFALIARFGVGIPFILLAFAKLDNPPLFLKSIEGYDVLPLDPPALINGIAIFMPWAELVIGGFLILGIFPRGSAFVALAMLLGFTGLVLARGIEIMNTESIGFFEVAFDCGCGTGVVDLWKKMLENTGMILCALYATITNARLWRLATFEGPPKRKAIYADDAA